MRVYLIALLLTTALLAQDRVIIRMEQRAPSPDAPPPPPPPPGAITNTISTPIRGPIPAVPTLPPERPPLRPEDAASISGIVTNHATGEPLRKATVRAQRRGEPAPMPPAAQNANAASTDATGKFTIANLEPGKYILSAEHTGYVNMNYGARAPGKAGRPITLAPAQKMSTADIALTPQGVITGRVVDEDGEPLPNIAVTVLRTAYQNGQKQFANVNSTTTDDRGIYRIPRVPPGRYNISAAPYQGMADSAIIDRSKDSGTYITTYFPGTTDPATATLVTTAPGTETQGIDFRLKKDKVVTVRGRLIGPTGQSPFTPITMVRLGASPTFSSLMGTASGEQRAFEIRGVPAGTYTIRATVFGGNDISGVAEHRLEVGTDNIDNLLVELHPGVPLNIEARFDQPAEIKLDTIGFSLRAANQRVMYDDAASSFDQDGRLTLPAIPASPYEFSFTGLPANYYVKSARAGQFDILETGLDTSQSDTLQFVLSAKAAKVTGAVTARNDQPLPNATVVLVPQKQAWRAQPRFYHTTTADQYGRFTLEGITPGEYKAFAWEEVPATAWMNADFLRPIESQGKPVKLAESATESITLKALPEDAQ